MFIFFHGAATLIVPRPCHCRSIRFTLRHATLSRTLDKWSARRRDLYLTTHSTHMRRTSMSPAGFEHAVPTSERPQTRALDHATYLCIYLAKLVRGHIFVKSNLQVLVVT